MSFLNKLDLSDYEVAERIGIKLDSLVEVKDGTIKDYFGFYKSDKKYEQQAIIDTISDKQIETLNQQFNDYFKLNINELNKNQIIELIKYWS